jgi:hypothetical protein
VTLRMRAPVSATPRCEHRCEQLGGVFVLLSFCGALLQVNPPGTPIRYPLLEKLMGTSTSAAPEKKLATKAAPAADAPSVLSQVRLRFPELALTPAVPPALTPAVPPTLTPAVPPTLTPALPPAVPPAVPPALTPALIRTSTFTRACTRPIAHRGFAGLLGQVWAVVAHDPLLRRERPQHRLLVQGARPPIQLASLARADAALLTSRARPSARTRPLA